ncbi:hypothetical protein SAMN02745218_01177 [Desulfofundulus australicus DSM 11792]|uniref:Uncharacterized protein n=1 Tax=Desulfofundulus australicus DSM 11792 TaxID=1121425 RepID=A0A1M4XUU1_9FIRM|nr:hypothetical protein [Desulfofundulus australicus]SHE97180.1 hypothetical protein SAMN02745218_01177 [Desulfofundulus australicus DSM 11792]
MTWRGKFAILVSVCLMFIVVAFLFAQESFAAWYADSYVNLALHQSGEFAVLGGDKQSGETQGNAYPTARVNYVAPAGQTIGALEMLCQRAQYGGRGYIDILQNGTWITNWATINTSPSGNYYYWILPPSVTAIRIYPEATSSISYLTWTATFYYYANNAKSSADAAKASADVAATNAQNAYNAAQAAKASADTAAARVWDSAEGKSAATLAKEARNNTIYNNQSAAYWAYLAAQNSLPLPTITKVQGQNGATCTTGSTFTVVISATPSSGVNYRVTCGSFDSGWVTSNAITISSGIVSGANTATVQVKNAAGTVAQTMFTFFKV